MHTTTSSLKDKDVPLLAVTLPELANMLSCGLSTARAIAEQAEARIMINRRVLYSVDKVRKYLTDIAQ